MTHLVLSPVECRVGEFLSVDAKNLVDVDVGAALVDLGVVGPKCFIRDTVYALDPSAGAEILAPSLFGLYT